MTHSERAYFSGDHCHHVAARDEHNRLREIERKAFEARCAREWAKLDGGGPVQHARDHLAAMSPERRALLNREWSA